MDFWIYGWLKRIKVKPFNQRLRLVVGYYGPKSKLPHTDRSFVTLAILKINKINIVALICKYVPKYINVVALDRSNIFI